MDSSIVGASTVPQIVIYGFQQKCSFYPNGRFWVFWYDGTNIVFSSSSDGQTWENPTAVRTMSSYIGFDLDIYGNYIHYVATDYLEGENIIHYRKGLLNSDGTITWLSDEETFAVVPSPYPLICVDSNGDPWIGWFDDNGQYVVGPRIQLLDDFEDGDLEGWTTGGDANWTATTDSAHSGNWSACSGEIGDSQESWIQREVTGPAVLKFWWKVSSEKNHDWLIFYIDDVEIARISGEVDWTSVFVEIPEGNHTIKWKYVKDESVSEGLDKGWIDDIELRKGKVFVPLLYWDYVKPLALTDGKMYVIYTGYDAEGNMLICGTLWNGSQWSDTETVLRGPFDFDEVSTTTIGDDIYIAWNDYTAGKVYGKKRIYASGWGSDEEIHNESVSPFVVSDISTGDIYCIWLKTDDHIYYKKRVNGVWDPTPTDWIDESAEGLAGYDFEYLGGFFRSYNGYIGIVYPTKKTSPYNVKFAFLTVIVAVAEAIVAKNFPMDYLPSPAKAIQLTSKVSGATITKVNQDFPLTLIKKDKAQELKSKFTPPAPPPAPIGWEGFVEEMA
jgi:hypothetical protein